MFNTYILFMFKEILHKFAAFFYLCIYKYKIVYILCIYKYKNYSNFNATLKRNCLFK